MKFLSGFESTHIFGTGKDVLELTRHTDLCHEDLKLARSTNLDLIRYSAPWHSIEKTKGVYDWSWMDEALDCMKALRIEPIIDPLHHTSFPEWLKNGFANPEFPTAYLRFVEALAERYPWITHYTIINEPFVTTWFCGHEGVWYPYHKSNRSFVQMILHIGEATNKVTRMLIEKIPGVQFVHVDAAEKHRAMDVESKGHEDLHNELRFLVPDLTLGKINEEHSLYHYFRRHGATEKRLNWFIENPARIDILGLDYYAHCELEWGAEGRIYPNKTPVGFAEVAMDYVNRYELPVMLTETNIRGYVSDRISWLKFMVEQCELLQTRLTERNLEFKGFCWYPFIDSTDWCSLVTQANCNIDPQGIYWLNCETHTRNASELSEIFTALARGEITSKDIPAYRFQSPLDETLKGFLPLMQHWEWRNP